MSTLIPLDELTAFGVPRRAVERLQARLGAAAFPADALRDPGPRAVLTAAAREDAPRLERAAEAWLRHAVALEAVEAQHGLPHPGWSSATLGGWLEAVGHPEVHGAAGLACEVALWGGVPEPVARASVRAAWQRPALRPPICAALRWLAARWWAAPIEAAERRQALGALDPAVVVWLDCLNARTADPTAAVPANVQLVRWELDPTSSRVQIQVTGQIGRLARSWQGDVDLPGGGSPDVHVSPADAHPEAGRLAVVAGLELALQDPELARVLDEQVRRPAWSGLVSAVRLLGEATETSLAWRLQPLGHDWAVEPCRITLGGPAAPFAHKTSATPVCLAEASELARHPADHAALRLLRQVPRAATAEIVAALAGHPGVLIAAWGGGVPVEVSVVPVVAGLEPVPGGAMFRLRADDLEVSLDLPPVQLLDDLPRGRLVVAAADARVLGLARVLRREGTFVPDEALPTMAAGLCALARTTGLRVDPALQPERHPAHGAPALHLRDNDDHVELRVRVQPGPGCALELPGQGSPEVYLHSQGSLLGLLRDLAAERAAAGALLTALGLGATPPVSPWTWKLAIDEGLCDLLDAAAAHGASVSWTGAPLAIARPKPEQLRVVAGNGRRWFEAGAALEVDGCEVPWAELLEAAEAGAPMLRLAGRRVLALSRTMRRAVLGLDAARSAPEWARGVALAELEDAGVDVLDAGPAGADLARVRAAWSAPWSAPAGLRANLRPHQAEGAAWLSRLSRWAPGAVLADDMGLGKTVQALCLLVERAPRGPALVVAPTSLVGVWAAEAARFAPDLRVHTDPLRRATARVAQLSAGDVLVTTWGSLRRHAEALADVPWATRVLDEAHAVKGHLTATAQAARRIRSGFCVALTGTPIENQTSELWSLFDVAVPELLGPWEHFRDRFADPIEARGDAEASDVLRGVLRPYLLRRTKDEVAPELPPRREHTATVHLSAAERALYDEARRGVLGAIAAAGPRATSIAMLRGLQHLRMAANAPALLDPSSPIASSKRQALQALLARELAADRQVIVFSQFLGQLRSVADWLHPQGVPFAVLDGSTPRARRDDGVARFQRGEVRVFLISLRAGGTGLTLTAAHTVLHADPWWNPAVEDQATDRAHRIGQGHAVDVYRLVSADTVEEEILRLHQRKRQLAASVLRGAADAARLTFDELAAILGVAA